MILAVVFVAGIFGRLAVTQIGGTTGDVLGATQQLCEATALIAAAALFDRLGGWWG